MMLDHPASLPAEKSPAQPPESLTAQRPHCDACAGLSFTANGPCRECGGSGRAPAIDLKAAA